MPMKITLETLFIYYFILFKLYFIRQANKNNKNQFLFTNAAWKSKRLLEGGWEGGY